MTDRGLSPYPEGRGSHIRVRRCKCGLDIHGEGWEILLSHITSAPHIEGLRALGVTFHNHSERDVDEHGQFVERGAGAPWKRPGCPACEAGG